MKKFKIYLLFFFVLVFFNDAKSQVYQQLINDTVMFSFNTVDEKIISLFYHPQTKQLEFRIEHHNKIERQFSNNSESTSQAFTYSYYLRPGGTSNDGLDFNYVYFVHDSIKYVLYETTSATNNQTHIGLKLIDIKSLEIKDMQGKVETMKGNLIKFRNSALLPEGSEIFD